MVLINDCTIGSLLVLETLGL